MFQIECFIATFLLINCLLPGIAGDCGCNKISRSKYDSANVENEIPTESCAKSMKPLEFPYYDDMVKVNGGDYIIGTNDPIFESDRESPERMLSINGFYIDKYEVSNAEFTDFVEATKYVTYAEKFGDSFVFQGQLSPETRDIYSNNRVVSAPWWYKVNGTNWKHPEGVESSIDSRMNHPVVHVSWFDANAFCKWKEKRLPTEDEWEVACRGGKKRKLYPWGNKLSPGDAYW